MFDIWNVSENLAHNWLGGFNWASFKIQNRAYFRKAGHAHGMSEIGIIIESLGQFEDVTPPRQYANTKFLESKNTKKL